MFQVTSPLASLFIALHHNVTFPAQEGAPPAITDPVYYTSGMKDFPAIFFYLLIAIVMHQIIQEYLLDKVNRKLHLSKVKHSKFNESGQLLSFYLVSLIWAGDILFRENLFHVRSLWDGYPHVYMTFMFKFFFIVQISYWLHIFPELYFQKHKREEMGPKIQYASLYLCSIGAAYLFNYTRVALPILILQYVVEAVFHACRLLSYAEKVEIARPLYHLHEVLFVLARLASITLAVLTFWYGLALLPVEQQVIDVANGIFNTSLFRLFALVAIGLLQAWLMWNFITFHIRRMRENAALSSSAAAANASEKKRKTQQEKAKARKEKQVVSKKEAEKENDDEMDLPEVDRDTKKALRQRK
jgi:translocating chain-associated membrane protein 1